MPDQEAEFSFKGLFVPLSTIKVIIWIGVIGLGIFFNSLFNGFIFDDFGSIVRNLNAHTISAIPNIFLNHLADVESSNYYRPFPLTFYTIIYSLFQISTFPYHFIQLLFHIGNAILIFLIFKKFLNRRLSFFISLLFLVHPINEETVVYISNLQDTLFIFFGLLAFYLLQQKYSLKKFLFIAISLLCSLLSKETGILFILLCLLNVIIFEKGKLKKYSLFIAIPVIFYLFLRLISHVPLNKPPLIPIMVLPFGDRMINAPAIVFYYIKGFIYPMDLAALNSWIVTKVNFNDFVLPLIIDVVFIGALVFISFMLKIQKKLFLFFFLWFILGLLVHIQVIPLDYTVADHFFYFPLIGLLAIIGLALQEIKINKQEKNIILTFGIIILILLSGITMIRNSKWSNQTVLLAEDEKISRSDYLQELMYGNGLISEANTKQAVPHIQKAVNLFPQSPFAWNSLGIIYYESGDILRARYAFEKSLSVGKYYGAYENMALLLLDHDNIYKAKDFIVKNSNRYPTSEKLWYYRILVANKLKDYKDEIYAAQHYYLLKQDKKSYTILYYLQNHLHINLED